MMSLLCLLAAFCLVFFAPFSTASCTYKDSNGNKYDLSNLKSKSGYEYDSKDSVYYLNICGNSRDCDDAPVCVESDSGSKSYGLTSGQKFEKYAKSGSGVTLIYEGGESCGPIDRTATLNIGCDKKEDKLKITDAEQVSCGVVLSMKSKYACPMSSGSTSGGGGGGLDGGWIFLIVLFSCLVVYFVAGAVWQYKRHEAQGTDLVIHKEFWSSVPGLVKDGNIFFYHKIRSCIDKDYQAV